MDANQQGRAELLLRQKLLQQEKNKLNALTATLEFQFILVDLQQTKKEKFPKILAQKII